MTRKVTSENDYNMNVLCATSGVDNTGIDSKEVRSVIRLDFPPFIMDMSQEKGRTERNPTATHEKYSYNLYYSLELFLFLYKQILTHIEGRRPDVEYQLERTHNLLNTVKLLCSHTVCFSLVFEVMVVNPLLGHIVLDRCGNYRNCKQHNRTFPAVVK